MAAGDLGDLAERRDGLDADAPAFGERSQVEIPDFAPGRDRIDLIAPDQPAAALDRNHDGQLDADDPGVRQTAAGLRVDLSPLYAEEHIRITATFDDVETLPLDAFA